MLATQRCPCGFLGSKQKECVCTPPQILRYVSKISGPLLDRIDLHVEVPEVKYRELTRDPDGECSAEIAARVETCRQIQLQRFSGRTLYANAQMSPAQIRRYCKLDAEPRKILEQAIQSLGFSARAYDRILKVSRTIADLDGSEQITGTHVSEAVQYRSLDRNFWETW